MIQVLRFLSLVTVIGFIAGCGQDPQPSPPVAEAASQPVLTEAASVAPATEPVAATSAGKVRGFIENDILVFKGIRYGADTATTRFAAPEPPAPWADIAEASAFGAWPTAGWIELARGRSHRRYTATRCSDGVPLTR